MLATGLGACSQELDHYETLVLFVIFCIKNVKKNSDFYIKTRCTRSVVVFFPQSKNVI